MKRRGVLAWGVVAVLMFLLAGLPGLWIWARQRAAQREKAEKAAVAALELLALLQADFHKRGGSYWTRDVAGFVVEMHVTTVHHSNPMFPVWDEIYQGDVRGKARPTSYGYLFEALPAKGFAYRAFPAPGDRLGRATFMIDERGEVIAK